jgi:hypothetical protein
MGLEREEITVHTRLGQHTETDAASAQPHRLTALVARAKQFKRAASVKPFAWFE